MTPERFSDGNPTERPPAPTGDLLAAHEEMLERDELVDHVATYRLARELAAAVREAGGQSLLIGGCVRDMMLARPPKDYDVEIRGLSAERVLELADGIAPVKEVGQAYGILKLDTGPVDLDVSLPRRDSKVSEGHTGFEVNTDPHLPVEEAARRRDFTINAMGLDLLTGELHDPFDGASDLAAGRLRVVDPGTFVEDPLRALRAIQFVGRFELELDLGSAEIVRAMADSMAELPGERLKDEWTKLLLESRRPSLGLELGMELGVFDRIHPQLPALVDVPQNPVWHPEGDVWRHTCMVVDEAAELVRANGLSGRPAEIVMLAAVCHDFGKPAVTEHKNGRWVALGHEREGVEPARAFLNALVVDNDSKKKILKLVEYHMVPRQLYAPFAGSAGDVKDGAFRRMAVQLHPATIEQLAVVFEADQRGRGPFTEEVRRRGDVEILDPGTVNGWMLERARALAVADALPANVVTGKDLIALELEPGRHFGEIIRAANDLRDDHDLGRDEILERIRGSIRNGRVDLAAL